MTAAASRPLVTRAQADAFFDAWRARHHARDDLSHWLHARLLDVTLVEEPPALAAQRPLAITTVGVPVVYSHKCTHGDGARFRMLADPGGTAVSVAEQVRLSRDMLSRFCGRAGWQNAQDRVEAVLDVLLPANPDALAQWHGGLGFGLEIGTDGPDLRLYCNVRHGTFQSRWQRFADAVGEFADDRAKPAFLELLDRAGPRTVPAGLGLAMAGGEVYAIRLYCGLTEATAESAIAAAPADLGAWGPAIEALVESHRASFGELGEQDITVAFDFAVRDGLMVPAVARYKVDLRCERANAAGDGAAAAWAREFAASRGLGAASLGSFVSDLAGAFGGCTFQYVSLGCRRGGVEELGVYCIPGRTDAAPETDAAS